MSDPIMTYNTMPTRNRREIRAKARHDRRAHGAWRTAVHREVELSQRLWQMTRGAAQGASERRYRKRRRLTVRMVNAHNAARALPLRPHFLTLSAWMLNPIAPTAAA